MNPNQTKPKENRQQAALQRGAGGGGFPTKQDEQKRVGFTGIPLEQLIPAPLTVTILLALAMAMDMSESWRRAEKSAWSVEDRRWSRGSEGGMPALLMSQVCNKKGCGR